MSDKLDYEVTITLDGPFGAIAGTSAEMRLSEAAMTAAHYKVGEDLTCKIISIKITKVKR